MRSVIAIAVLIALPLQASLADVYRSVDAEGHIQYSDTPSPGAQLIKITTTVSRPSAPTPPASSVGSANAPSPQRAAAQLREQLNKEQAQQKVQADLQQEHAEQCKKLQDDYQKQIQSRRIYNVGPNGEREYLSDAEADQQRVNTRVQMEQACNSQ